MLAPILLVTLRFAQGVALGGEWAGAVLLSVEHGTDKQRGRNASFAQMGPSIGTLVATGAIALTSWLVPQDQWLHYGWRLPLLASVVLVAFGLWLRVGVSETPQFTQLQERVRAPLGEVVRHHWRQLIIAGGVRMGPDVMYSLLAVFLLSYLTTTLGMSRTLAVTALTIGAAFNAVFILVAGMLSDRFGRRAVYGAGAVVAIVWVWVLFPLLESKTELAIRVAIVSGLSIHAFMYGPQARVHRRAVSDSGALCRFVAGVHARRRVRGRHRAAGVSGAVPRVRNADGGGDLRDRRAVDHAVDPVAERFDP